MAIRWDQIQNLNVTEDEINLLTGLTATAAELNILSGYTGTVSDLNDLIGTDVDLAAHEALDYPAAHTIPAGSLDGLALVDGTVTQSKMAFNVAIDTDISSLQTQIDDNVSDTAVQQTQIDNLFGIVIPGQGADISDAIDQTIAHIEITANAHVSSAISYGDYYTMPADVIAATTTSLTFPSNIIKFFRVGESLRFQDDITASEDVVISTVDYTTGEVTFPVTTNGYTTADNGIVWTLAEDQTKEALDRSFRNDGETQLVLREGVWSLTFVPETLTADRTYTLRDEDVILGNPDLTGEALSVLRVNAGETDVEWHDLTAADIDYDNSVSLLIATDVQAAVDELTSSAGTHASDTSIHFTEGSISHLNIQDIGTNSHAAIDTHIADATLHRIINDAGTSVTELWSANKINSELGSHSHTLDSLSNVDGTGKGAGSILEWNGTTTWIVGTKGEVNTASNLGGGNGVFNSKIGFDLQFKSLTAGTGITLSPSGTEIDISTTGEANTASNVGGANGVFKQKALADLEFYTLAAGANITITPSGDTLEFAATGGGSGGTAIDRNQVTHGFAVLDAIYHNGTIWVKAQADDDETLAEYVVSDVADVDNFTANKFGEITVVAHGKTIGEHYFLSDTVAGDSQITEPANFSSTLFYVEDANTIHVEVYRPAEVAEVEPIDADFRTTERFLATDITANDSNITSLRLENLVIGKSYILSGKAQLLTSTSNGQGQLYFWNSADTSVQIGRIVVSQSNSSGTNLRVIPIYFEFVAVDDFIRVEFVEVGTASLQGNASNTQTTIKILETPFNFVDGNDFVP